MTRKLTLIAILILGFLSVGVVASNLDSDSNLINKAVAAGGGY